MVLNRPDDPGTPVHTKTCQRCGGEVDEKQVYRCPWCFKEFCHACRFPRGSADFCSRACSEAMFHGGDDEESPEDDKDIG